LFDDLSRDTLTTDRRGTLKVQRRLDSTIDRGCNSMSDRKQISLRLDDETLRRAERLSEPIAQESREMRAVGGSELPRASVLRLAIVVGLDELEERHDVDPDQVTLDERINDNDDD
jgi:hypothetical protein